MERIDILNANMCFVGLTTIDEIHQKGLWHQTFACWLFNPKTQVIYLQLCGPKNRVGANTFDSSASGHLSAGEKPEQGFRELEEELGLTVNFKDATYLGIYKNIARLPNYTNNEFCHIYLVKTDKNLSDFTLREDEVSGLYELKLSDIDNLLAGKSVNIKSLNNIRTITLPDMCNAEQRISDGYYKWVFDKVKGKQK